MTNIYRHSIRISIITAVWLPLIWWVHGLQAQHAPHATAWQLAGWELVLVAAFLCLPTLAMHRMKLLSERDCDAPPW